MIELGPNVDHVLDIVFSHGTVWVYLVIFLACFIENIFPPFPGDTFIIAAGALSAAGRLNPVASGVSVLLGGALSVLLLYLIGRKYGREYFLRKNFRSFPADDVHKAERLFDRWGGLILIASRFLFGVRSALSIAAGIVDYDRTKMILFSILSYILFIVAWMLLGSGVVANLDRIVGLITQYGTIIGLALGAFVIWYLARNWWRSKEVKQ